MTDKYAPEEDEYCFCFLLYSSRQPNLRPILEFMRQISILRAVTIERQLRAVVNMTGGDIGGRAQPEI